MSSVRSETRTSARPMPWRSFSRETGSSSASTANSTSPVFFRMSRPASGIRRVTKILTSHSQRLRVLDELAEAVSVPHSLPDARDALLDGPHVGRVGDPDEMLSLAPEDSEAPAVDGRDPMAVEKEAHEQGRGAGLSLPLE